MIGAIANIGGVYHSPYLYRINQTRQPAGTENEAVRRASESRRAGTNLHISTARRAQPEVPVQPAEAVKPVRDNTFNKDALLHYMANDPAEGAVRKRIIYLNNDGAAQPGAEETNHLPGQEKAGEFFPGESGNTKEAGSEEEERKVGETPSAQEVAEEGECQTCKRRKYQDGSDDPGVSFKTATRVDPRMVQSAVRGHENEHVVRERAKALQEDRRVVSQYVTYHNAICPECGKVYLAGGTTRTVTVNQPEPFTPAEEEKDEKNPFSALA